ncbi:MAG: helix-turn-helix domain-containing protein [bacterium]
MDMEGKMLAAFFLEKRKNSGLTQVELARKAGLSQGLITQIEKFRKKPSKTVTIKLFKALTQNSDSLSDDEILKSIRSSIVFPKRDLNNSILFSDVLIRNKDQLYNLENFYSGILTLYNISFVHPILPLNNEISSKFLEIEKMAEKYAFINFFAIGGLRIGDYAVIQYYDSYDIDKIFKFNIKSNDIFVIEIMNTLDLILSRIRKAEYFLDPDNIFYIIELSGVKILLKKTDFKIKGRVILTVHQELPEFRFFDDLPK